MVEGRASRVGGGVDALTGDGGEQAGSEVDLELDGSGFIQGMSLAMGGEYDRAEPISSPLGACGGMGPGRVAGMDSAKKPDDAPAEPVKPVGEGLDAVEAPKPQVHPYEAPGGRNVTRKDGPRNRLNITE